MIKNKNIYLKSQYNEDDYDQLQLTKYCEWPNCEKKGEYKAPTSREKLREFKFFCLEHIKEFNKTWDYFKGRSSEQIYDEVSNDAYWHRKTYKKVNEFKIEDNLNLFEKSHFKTFSKKNLIKPFDDNIVTSLKILNLENFISIDQLKKQYKKMVKLFHPDLTKSGSSEKIIKLNEAYSILKNHFNK